MGRFQDPGCTIFVKNIEPRVTEEHLWELFLQAGPLRNVHIPLERGTTKKRNFAFVTYRDELSVEYACELFNQIRLFKKPIYCNPSKDNANKSSTSFNQSNRSNASDTAQSPTTNNSLIEGILNRSNSAPLTSTPFNGKRKFTEEGRMPPPDNRNDSRVVLVNDDRDRSRYGNSGNSGDRDRSRYGSSNDRDRNRYDDSYRSPRSQDDRGEGYNRSDSRENGRYDDSRSNSRYERSNSFGSLSPMHMQAVNQSRNNNQYNRHNSSSSRDNSNVGAPMRQDSRNVRRPSSQPY